MLMIPNSSKDSIKSAAKEFGISFNKEFLYLNKLKRLTEEKNVNYYWLGFLMADGCFSLSGNSNLVVKISIKDEQHLKILADYLNVNIHYQTTNNFGSYKCANSCSIAVRDKINAEILIKRFKLYYRKTENPPDLSCLNSMEKFLSFFVGFIDGDGCITANGNLANMIRIQCHKNWISNFEFFSLNLKKYFNIDSKSYIDSDGYARFVVYSFNQLKKIKINLLDLNIPFLKRKWDKIDELKNDVFKINEHKEEFIKLYTIDGWTLQAISKYFKCSLTPLFRFKKELNLKRNKI